MSWSSFSGHCVLSRSDSPGSVSLNLSGSASLRVQEVHTWWMPLIFLTWQLSIILSVFTGRLSKLLSVIQEWSQVIYMCLLRTKTLNFLKGRDCLSLSPRSSETLWIGIRSNFLTWLKSFDALRMKLNKDFSPESTSPLFPCEGRDELQIHSNSSYFVVGKFQAEISLNSGYESLSRPPSKPCNCPTNELKAFDHLQSAVGVWEPANVM